MKAAGNGNIGKEAPEGELITRYIEASCASCDDLLTLENEPVLVHARIEQHMNPALMNRMKQTIRARRKRHLTLSISIRVRSLSTLSLSFGSVLLARAAAGQNLV